MIFYKIFDKMLLILQYYFQKTIIIN